MKPLFQCLSAVLFLVSLESARAATVKSGASAPSLVPIISLVHEQPIFAEELDRQLHQLTYFPQLESRLSDPDAKPFVEPASPAPYEILQARTAQFALALAAHPELIAAQREELSQALPQPDGMGNLENAARFLQSRPKLGKMLGKIRRGMDLTKAGTVEDFRREVGQLFDHFGWFSQESPAILLGQRLPEVGTFQGEKILKQTVEDGIIRAETKRYVLEVGTRYIPGKDISYIASAIREDIKRYVRFEKIPPYRYSVRIQRYSGGASVTIRVSGVPRGSKMRVEVGDVLKTIAGRYEKWYAVNGDGSYSSHFSRIEFSGGSK